MSSKLHKIKTAQIPKIAQNGFAQKLGFDGWRTICLKNCFFASALSKNTSFEMITPQPALHILFFLTAFEQAKIEQKKIKTEKNKCLQQNSKRTKKFLAQKKVDTICPLFDFTF